MALLRSKFQYFAGSQRSRIVDLRTRGHVPINSKIESNGSNLQNNCFFKTCGRISALAVPNIIHLFVHITIFKLVFSLSLRSSRKHTALAVKRPSNTNGNSKRASYGQLESAGALFEAHKYVFSWRNWLLFVCGHSQTPTLVNEAVFFVCGTHLVCLFSFSELFETKLTVFLPQRTFVTFPTNISQNTGQYTGQTGFINFLCSQVPQKLLKPLMKSVIRWQSNFFSWPNDNSITILIFIWDLFEPLKIFEQLIRFRFISVNSLCSCQPSGPL